MISLTTEGIIKFIDSIQGSSLRPNIIILGIHGHMYWYTKTGTSFLTLADPCHEPVDLSLLENFQIGSSKRIHQGVRKNWYDLLKDVYLASN